MILIIYIKCITFKQNYGQTIEIDKIFHFQILGKETLEV